MRRSPAAVLIFALAAASCSRAAPDPEALPAIPETVPVDWQRGPSVFPWALAPPSAEATAAYIQKLDLDRFVERGTSYTAPFHDPRRLGVDLGTLDRVHDYDFDLVSDVEQRLAGVDRLAVLEQVFGRLTVDSTSSLDDHRAVAGFVQRAMMHSFYLQPMYPDGQMVLDPLVLLELGEGRCGQSNRVAADLLSAGGYDVRMVQFGAHIAAEVYYDDDWHYLEVDLFSGDQVPLDEGGEVPSVFELSLAPEIVDRADFQFEPSAGYPLTDQSLDGEPHLATRRVVYPSFFLFSSLTGQEPYIYVKTATPEQAAKSRFFGWNYYDVVPDTERVLTQTEPIVYSVEIGPLSSSRIDQHVTIEFNDDPTILERVVSVSSQSRGWTWLGAPRIAGNQVQTTWSSEHYDRVFEELPNDLGVFTVTGTTFEFDLPEEYAEVPVWFSFTSRDAYAIEIGKQNLPPSEEFILTPRDNSGSGSPQASIRR